MELIYRRASHVRGTFIEFLLAVHEMMPAASLAPACRRDWGDDAPKERGKKAEPQKISD